MGKAMFKSGLVLCIIGGVFILIFGAGFAAVMADTLKEEEVLDTEDFQYMEDDTYIAEISTKELTSSAKVKVISNSVLYEVEVEITVRDSKGDHIAHTQGPTQRILYFDVSPADSGDYHIFMEIKDDRYSKENVTISVMATGISDPYLFLCMGTGGVGCLGFLMAIAGTILFIVHYKRRNHP